MFEENKIGQANFLTTDSGQYIPLKITFIDSDCDKINKML